MLSLTLEEANKVLSEKARWGVLFCFYLDSNYIFRPLTINEAESVYHLSEHIDQHIIDEWVVTQTIVVGSLSYLLNEAEAGLCAALAAAIIEKSTISDIKEVARLLEEERALKSNTAAVLDSMVKLVIPSQIKNSKDITYRQQLAYVALAEDITGKKLELTTQTLPKNKRGKKFSPETAAILSKEVADKPDFKKDNASLRDL